MKLYISGKQSNIILNEFIQEMDDIKFAIDNLTWKVPSNQLKHIKLASGKIHEAIKLLSNCELNK